MLVFMSVTKHVYLTTWMCA